MPKENIKYDVILIGSQREGSYLGSKTFYLEEMFKKYAPNLNVGLYDNLAPDEERIENIAKNFIFIPWVDSLDLNWCAFFLNLPSPSKKILYTDSYYWYQEQKNRIIKLGFNLESLFNYIAFSSRENAGWWDSNIYKYFGLPIFTDFFEKREISQPKEKIIYLDTPWDLSVSEEPYNAIRIIKECFPKIKKKYPDVKIISQKCDFSWVDENLPEQLPLNKIIDYYEKSQIYVLSHSETCGYAQVEANLCGTKVVTTRDFSNQSALLAGEKAFSFWSFEEGIESFMNAIDEAMKDYNKIDIKNLALSAHNDKLVFENIRESLWGID